MEIEAVDGRRVLRLGDGPNMFDAEFVEALHGALDAVVDDPDATSFVTVASGKHYSNGFDLTFLGSLEMDALQAFMHRTSAALGRILVLPVPTVAAINGHAFGIGALLALAHDQRVQNEQRGWFCLPEIDLGMRFNPFQLGLVTGKLSRPTAAEAVLSGRRYDGPSSLAAGIVDAVAAPDDLVGTASGLAEARVGKERSIVSTLKGDLYAAMLGHLER
ncbi:MAG TPA: enoyl-CoA hydratase/isomerase family protein [Acidimicrobiia bacterium]